MCLGSSNEKEGNYLYKPIHKCIKKSFQLSTPYKTFSHNFIFYIYINVYTHIFIEPFSFFWLTSNKYKRKG